MLRNKYVIAGLGAVLFLVLVYNITFFSGRKKGIDRPSAAPGTTVQGGGDSTSPVPAKFPESSVAGEWRRDPFWYPGGRSRGAPQAGKKTPGLHLEATMAKGGKAYAIINGDIVGIGERFHGYIVTEIGDQFVKLKGPGGTKTLKLTGDPTEKE
ncbi:MAG: hypothetical protein AABZ15_07600 [Nitrospirota bacterium]